VDAFNGTDTLEREDVSQKQVAVADRIVLTKLDLAGAAESALLARLKSLNSGAPLLRANHGRIAPRDLFATSLYDPATKSLDVNRWLADEAHGHFRAEDAEIEACAIVRERPIRAVALTLFLEALAEHCGVDLLRLKGIVNLAESPDRPVVIHGVQHLVHPPVLLAAWPKCDPHTSRLVFITRDLPRDVIEEGLRAFNDAAASPTS
jgi:G3E family GTPase